jgi:hypothetical protein
MDGVYADASVLGDEWVYCFSFIKNIDEYWLQAYDHSGIVRWRIPVVDYLVPGSPESSQNDMI